MYNKIYQTRDNIVSQRNMKFEVSEVLPETGYVEDFTVIFNQRGFLVLHFISFLQFQSTTLL